MKRKGFMFFESYWRAIENLPRDVQGDVLISIVKYGIDGETPEQLKPIASAVFEMAKPVIDWCNKLRENGLKGGAPKGSRNNPNGRRGKSPETNQELTKNKPRTNQELTKNLPRTNHCYPKDKGKDKGKDKDMDILVIKDYSSGETPDSMAEEIQKYYNEQISLKGAKLCRSITLTDRRKAHILGRVNEYGIDKVKKVIDKAVVSRFLNYDCNTRPDIEWIMLPNNFPKILEGRYDNRQRGQDTIDPLDNKRVNDRWR